MLKSNFPQIIILSFSWTAFEQDLSDLYVKLPRLPKDLPLVVLQTKSASQKPIELKVRVQKLRKALEWLRDNNEVYQKFCDISEDNFSYYENNVVTTNDLNTVDQDWNPTPQRQKFQRPWEMMFS